VSISAVVLHPRLIGAPQYVEHMIVNVFIINKYWTKQDEMTKFN